jgi:hypothetical protein
MQLTDRDAISNIVIAQLGVSPSSIFDTTSNELPRVFWVAKGGYDGVGNGYMTSPFLTWRRAIRECKDGRGDIIIGGPGEYAETLDIGSGSTTSGAFSTDGYAKRNVKLIGGGVGAGFGHSGLVQIIGDGASAQPTIRVRGGYERGFLLKNMELDTNLLSQPAFEIITDDASAAPGATVSNYRFTLDNLAVRSRRPNIGFLFTGATLGDISNLVANGPTMCGVGFAGSPSNYCSDLIFKNLVFYNGFSTTTVADLATLISNSAVNNGFNTIGGQNLTNVLFDDLAFGSVATGAGGATNFINYLGSMTNVVHYNCKFPRQPTNGTNGIATLPTNVVVSGIGTTAGVFLAG